LDLVTHASAKKAPTEHFIRRFARYYTPAVVVLAALLAVFPPLLLSGLWSVWLHRALIFLVISCPCALVVSIPLGFFGGLGSASKKGVFIKGGNFLEALNHLDIVAFDKTGTLTQGVFEVTGIYPAPGQTNKSLLSLAARAETLSNHPIAKSICKSYTEPISHETLSDFQEITGCGVRVTWNGQIILAGNEALMQRENIAYTPFDHRGALVYVAADGVFAGHIVVSDVLRPDSAATLQALKALGVRKTVLLTGDNQKNAEAIANGLCLDEIHAGLLPHQKVEQIEQLALQKRPHKALAFIGDGVNDAPVLARADIGVAMGGLGSDAAIEAADIVLMTDQPSKLIEAIQTAKATKRIVRQNIVLALGVKILFLGLGALGFAGMWEAVFADVGVALLAILNATRIMRK